MVARCRGVIDRSKSGQPKVEQDGRKMGKETEKEVSGFACRWRQLERNVCHSKRRGEVRFCIHEVVSVSCLHELLLCSPLL
jgi:hypothetical protein